MADRKIMKDLGLNEKVAIELPVHIWLAFMAQYGTADWASDSASRIVVEIQEALLDPVYINERQAEAQAHQDMHENVLTRMFSSMPPGPDDDDPRNEPLT